MLARGLAPLLLLLLALPLRGDPTSGMTFALIPAGSFEMGTPATEPGREAQERLHTVTLSRPFYLAIHEVTQAQWSRIMRTSPSHFQGCPSCPVERVSFLDVQEFLRRLNEASAWPGYRLPTEAEWEYACRAGGREAFGASAALTSSTANIESGRTSRVGSFPANAFNLFDMSGNVWEWTADDHCAYPETAVTDPQRRCASGLKVIRGGSWRFGADSARCGLRYTHRPVDRGFSVGLRIAHDAK